MIQKLSLLLFAFTLISACATSGTNEVEGPSLYDRIKQASTRIKVVKADSAEACGPQNSCKYLGEVYCEYDEQDKRDNKDKICKKEMFTNIVRHGGDTYVVQQQGMVKRSLDHYRIFGQAYDCTGTNQKLHKEYAAEEKLKPLTQIQLVTVEYGARCKTIEGCKENERKWSCGSIRGDPFKRCRDKFVVDYQSGRSTTNHILYKEDFINGAGIYRLYIDSYVCKK